MVDEAIAGKHVDPEKLSTVGIDLDEFASNSEIAAEKHLPSLVQKYRADEGQQAELRDELHIALKDPNARVGLNYQMKVAGQAGGWGHISPLVAWNEEKDRYLVLDCWYADWAGPCWITWDRLWASMNDPDTISKIPRGFIVITKNRK